MSYQSSWDEGGELIACPQPLRTVLHVAWNHLQVPIKKRQTVLNTLRYRDEWGSYALVLIRALRLCQVEDRWVFTMLEKYALRRD